MVDVIIQSSLLDPAARPLIDGLAQEYDSLYGNPDRPGGARAEILRYPTEAFGLPLEFSSPPARWRDNRWRRFYEPRRRNR